MIRFLFVISVLFIAVANLHSQDRLKDYTFKMGDTGWRGGYYVPAGPLAKIESYKDKKKTIAHGRFAWYDAYGIVDSTGICIDGKRDGMWFYYNDKFKVTRRKDYVAGVLTGEEEYPEGPDAQKDTKPKEGEVESEFEGGLQGWQRYLTRNLRYPIDALRAGMQGAVRIAFEVDKQGEVNEPWVFKSVCYSIDEEAMRLIVKSPRWEPATKDGERVKSYKIQPIIFRSR